MTVKRMLEAGTVASVDDPNLQELLDKQACAEVMMTYCRAIDHRDEEVLRSVFHPDSYHRHGFEGPSSNPKLKGRKGQAPDFVAYALGILATHTHTHHHLGNIFVEVEKNGKTAYTEAYFTAFHRMRALGDPKAGPNAYDTEMDWWVGGRYMDRMEKRDGVWKIAFRAGMTDWTRIEPPSSQAYFSGNPEFRMQQSHKDMLFRRRSVFKAPKK
ncbi:MAG: nuclear transport factor 2 family protein [Alphaproteobacteria bacterium]